MTMEDIVSKMMEENFIPATDVEQVFEVGSKPARINKKKRIQKKWKKKYGYVPLTKKMKAKQYDVTINLIVDFCFKYNYPLPQELFGRGWYMWIENN